MSITFFTDTSCTATTTYDNWKDFFHPLKNKFCVTYANMSSHGQVRVDHMIQWLNMFYSDENLNSPLFLDKVACQGRVSTEEFPNFVQLVKSLPADKRWTAAFLYRAGNLSNGYILKYNDLNSQIIIRNNTLIRTNNNERESPVYSGVNDNALAYMSTISDYYTNFFSDKQTMFWDTANNNGIASIIKHALMFCVDYPYVTNGDSNLTLSQARLQALASPASTSFVIGLDSRSLSHITIQIKASKANRSMLYSIKSYSYDVLNVLPYPLTEQKENKPLLVGVELECCTDYTMQELVDAADDVFFCGKSDSSITGNKRHCVELVTAPASIKYLKRQYALWFNKLDYSKFDVSTQTSNGMHVHVGREHFRNELGQEDKNHIRNFCWFINNPANIEFFVYLSERGSLANMSHYTPFFPFNRDSTKFQAFKSICNTIGRGGFRGATNFKGGWDNAKTVEVRIFKGIVSYACIVKNLEVVDSVFHFTKSLTSYRDLTLKGYLAWLKTTPRNKYSVLKKFLEQADLHKLMISSEIKDVIFNEDNPEKIIDLLNKSPLKLTHEHVTALNKNRKRTFVMDKETHEIKLTTINRSKISFLDKEIAARYLRAS